MASGALPELPVPCGQGTLLPRNLPTPHVLGATVPQESLLPNLSDSYIFQAIAGL